MDAASLQRQMAYDRLLERVYLVDEGRVFCSESSTLRVLRAAGKVPVYEHRRRPVRPRPALDVSGPNRGWGYDGTSFPTIAGDYHLIPIIDGCSRKITGRYFGPEFTSRSVQAAWDKALANEGLLAEDVLPIKEPRESRGSLSAYEVFNSRRRIQQRPFRAPRSGTARRC